MGSAVRIRYPAPQDIYSKLHNLCVIGSSPIFPANLENSTMGSTIEKMCLLNIGDWCNGNTVAFEAVVRGSSPLGTT